MRSCRSFRWSLKTIQRRVIGGAGGVLSVSRPRLWNRNRSETRRRLVAVLPRLVLLQRQHGGHRQASPGRGAEHPAEGKGAWRGLPGRLQQPRDGLQHAGLVGRACAAAHEHQCAGIPVFRRGRRCEQRVGDQRIEGQRKSPAGPAAGRKQSSAIRSCHSPGPKGARRAVRRRGRWATRRRAAVRRVAKPGRPAVRGRAGPVGARAGARPPDHRPATAAGGRPTAAGWSP